MTTVAEKNRMIDCFAKKVYEVPSSLHILGPNAGTPEENFAELAAIASELELEMEDFGCFRILSQKDGDKRIVWCKRLLPQIQDAKKMFLDLIKEGMVPYIVGVDGKATSRVMKEFDPTAEEVIFMPQAAIRGG